MKRILLARSRPKEIPFFCLMVDIGKAVSASRPRSSGTVARRDASMFHAAANAIASDRFQVRQQVRQLVRFVVREVREDRE